MLVCVHTVGYDEKIVHCLPTVLDVLLLLQKEYPLAFQANIFFDHHYTRGTQVVDIRQTIDWIKKDVAELNRFIGYKIIYVTLSYV